MEWERLQEIFWSGRALPLEQRDSYLREACNGDQAALQQLQRMLAADGTADGVLDRAPSLFTPLAQSPTRPEERVGPYILGDELGRGGMGVVYRAYDPRLQREVALKFLAAGRRHPDVQLQFINEARAASALDHPNNCPVYDVGTTDDGRLYIAMAYCAGGSLAERIAAGPLPVGDAVRITIQVARALERAHRAGIVHRDIKPANIAFTEQGDARILDFGIAAFGNQGGAGAQGGTPAYMSPEQVRGAPVDHRTDIWALGVVLYEMLSGRKAFDAADRAQVAHDIVSNDPIDVRLIRPAVPPALARIVARALSKRPDQRYQSARELVNALLKTRAATSPRKRIVLAGAGALMLVVAGFVAQRLRSPAALPGGVDSNAVVVLPFRVSGDGSFRYLEEGMVDLFSAKLTGEGGPRATDPRSVLSRARGATLTQERGLAIARQLGAGHALFGNVVGAPSGLIINAVLIDVRGRVVGRGSAEGPYAALSSLVDRVVAELLSLKAGEEPQRLAALTSTSLDALRAYLEGQSAYRRGQFGVAVEKFGRALDFDSTFALAALLLDQADGWVGTGHAGERGRSIAWRWRERLSARDRALLAVRVGDAYPARVTIAGKLDATERALRLSPDRAELWYTLGDLHFHHGRVMGTADWAARAERGFARALELDSAFAAPRHHLIALFARQNRMNEALHFARASLAQEPRGSTADYIRWRLASRLGNTKAGREEFDSLTTETLGWIAMISIDDGLEQGAAQRALEIRAARPGTREQRLERLLSLHAAALNGGRPQQARALTDALREVQRDSTFYLRLRVLAALFGDGHRAAADSAATLLGRSNVRLDRCIAALWRGTASGARGEPSSVEQAVCEAAVSGTTVQLDELYRVGPTDFYWGDGHVEYAPIVLARLLEAKGDRAGALAALRRRPYFIGWQPFLAASLRAEGRLAEALGERDAAVRAYRHFLTLRHASEPSLQAATDTVRVALATLQRAPR